MKYFATLSDLDLIGHLRDGNHKAYHTIYNRYSSHITKFGLRQVQDLQTVNDLVADTFLYL